MKVHGPVQPTMDIILTRPLQFYGSAVGAICLGNRYRFYDVVGAQVGAPAEAAAGIQGMNADLFWIKASGVRGIGLIDGLELISGPDFATRGVKLDYRIERLHGRMREIREFVAG